MVASSLAAPVAHRLETEPRMAEPADDRELVRALRHDLDGAPARLYDRHAPAIRRVIVRVMGFDPEVPDLVHETFARALAQIHSLRDADRLGAWLTSIAVFVARGCIRKRSRQRWLRFRAPRDLPEVVSTEARPDVQSAMRRAYALLERLRADDRIAFTLRHIDGMEVTEVASACGVSLATAKRRLARARERFLVLARRDAVLGDWLADEAPGQVMGDATEEVSDE